MLHKLNKCTDSLIMVSGSIEEKQGISRARTRVSQRQITPFNEVLPR